MLTFVTPCEDGGPALDPIVLRAMLYYIREYPEQYHHPMEERYLFAALRGRTDDFDDVLDELQCEHGEGDARLRTVEHALTCFELKGESVAVGLRTLIEQYVKFCGNHRHVEETLIIPAAERFPRDWDYVDAAFEDRTDPFGSATFEGESLESLYHLIVSAVPKVGDQQYEA